MPHGGPFLNFTEIILRSGDGPHPTNLAHNYSNCNGRGKQNMHRFALQAKHPSSRELVEASRLQLRSVYFTTATPKVPATVKIRSSARCGADSSNPTKIRFSSLNGLSEKAPKTQLHPPKTGGKHARFEHCRETPDHSDDRAAFRASRES